MRFSPPVRMNRSGSDTPDSDTWRANASTSTSSGSSLPAATSRATARAASTMSQRPP